MLLIQRCHKTVCITSHTTVIKLSTEKKNEHKREIPLLNNSTVEQRSIMSSCEHRKHHNVNKPKLKQVFSVLSKHRTDSTHSLVRAKNKSGDAAAICCTFTYFQTGVFSFWNDGFGAPCLMNRVKQAPLKAKAIVLTDSEVTLKAVETNAVSVASEKRKLSTETALFHKTHHHFIHVNI